MFYCCSYTQRRTELNLPIHLSVQSHSQSSVCFMEYSILSVLWNAAQWGLRPFLPLLPHILMNMLKSSFGLFNQLGLWSNSKHNTKTRIIHSNFGSSIGIENLGWTGNTWKIRGWRLELFQGFDPHLTCKITFIMKKLFLYLCLLLQKSKYKEFLGCVALMFRYVKSQHSSTDS